jgi:hypothetical protein
VETEPRKSELMTAIHSTRPADGHYLLPIRRSEYLLNELRKLNIPADTQEYTYTSVTPVSSYDQSRHVPFLH